MVSVSSLFGRFTQIKALSSINPTNHPNNHETIPFTNINHMYNLQHFIEYLLYTLPAPSPQPPLTPPVFSLTFFLQILLRSLRTSGSGAKVHFNILERIPNAPEHTDTMFLRIYKNMSQSRLWTSTF